MSLFLLYLLCGPISHQVINLENYTKLRKSFQPEKASTFSGENMNDFLNKTSDAK